MALNVFWIDSMSTLGAIDFQLQKYRSNFDPWEGLSLPNVIVTERRLLPRGIHWRYYIDDLVFIKERDLGGEAQPRAPTLFPCLFSCETNHTDLNGLHDSIPVFLQASNNDF